MDDEQDIEIGKIVGSNSHIDYTCEIYTEGMRENPPDPTDFEFGQLVYIEKKIKGDKKVLVGIIYDTQIVDPDQGRTGPRLAQPEEQNIFQPSYVDEKKTLAGIAILGYGTVEEGRIKKVQHSIPKWTLKIDDVVRKLSEEDMLRFHELDGGIKLEYYQIIMDVAGGFAEDILSQVLDKLKKKRPKEAGALEVIQKNLEWRARIERV